MENAMITMKNINKGYMLGEERLPILKDINFQVNKGCLLYTSDAADEL